MSERSERSGWDSANERGGDGHVLVRSGVAVHVADPAVRASHDEGQARVGTESGSPVTAIDDHPGFFGPVVVPVPEPDTADRLFEALRLLSGVPQFSELKRARNPF